MKLTRSIKFFLVLIILCSPALKSGAQDIHISQFFETPLWRNPSLAGIYTGDIRVQAVYRDQWNSVTDAYRTGSLNAEFKMPVGRGNDFFTTGIEVLYDKAGSIGWTSTHILPAINYHKSLSSEHNRYLSLGFMGGMVQRRFDLSKMTTNSLYDGFGIGESFVQPNYTYLDGSVGMSYNSSIRDNPDNNFFIGAAYHHFNKPRNTFYTNSDNTLQPKWVFSGGLKLSVSDYAFLTIQADHSRQGSFKETVTGALYGLKIGVDPANPSYVIHAGTFLRWNDALIPAVKLDYAPFSFTLSYDVNISKLKQSSYGRGGAELSVSYIGFISRLDRSTINSTLCPRF
ncbi:MAG: PorP/SprF family type IX secretion system membrane protein [Bacteroidota bacterium]